MNSLIIFTLTTLLSTFTNASASALTCEEINTQKREQANGIQERNGIIGIRGAEIQADAARIDEVLLPELEKLKYNLSFIAIGIDVITSSQQVIGRVEIYMQRTMALNQNLKIALERFRKDFSPHTGRSLSEQMRDLVARGQIGRRSAEKLEQLANMVELLESTTPEWKAAEIELLQQYIEGSSFGDSLFNSVHQLKEKLAADLVPYSNAQAAELARADGVTTAIAGLRAEIDNKLQEIQGHQAAIQSGIARIDELHRMSQGCEPHEPRGLPPRMDH